ncbi:unnamed protein product [Closterium sp. Yama58-4]|nr:unnamed protein product [Closterium sp. Yama58-4]
MAPARPDDSRVKKQFGFPLFCGAWAPTKGPKAGAQGEEGLVVLAGGGGAGRHGIKSKIIACKYSFAADELSEVFSLSTGVNPAFKITAHPNGDCLIAAFADACRCDPPARPSPLLFPFPPPPPLSPPSFRLLFPFKHPSLPLLFPPPTFLPLLPCLPLLLFPRSPAALPILPLSTPFVPSRPLIATCRYFFSHSRKASFKLPLTKAADGCRVVAGSEDGRVRVFEWPSMDILMDVPRAHTSSLRDADINLDSTLVATTADAGPLKVWSVRKGTALATLSIAEGGTIHTHLPFHPPPFSLPLPSYLFPSHPPPFSFPLPSYLLSSQPPSFSLHVLSHLLSSQPPPFSLLPSHVLYSLSPSILTSSLLNPLPFLSAPSSLHAMRQGMGGGEDDGSMAARVPVWMNPSQPFSTPPFSSPFPSSLHSRRQGVGGGVVWETAADREESGTVWQGVGGGVGDGSMAARGSEEDPQRPHLCLRHQPRLHSARHGNARGQCVYSGCAHAEREAEGSGRAPGLRHGTRVFAQLQGAAVSVR